MSRVLNWPSAACTGLWHLESSGLDSSGHALHASPGVAPGYGRALIGNGAYFDGTKYLNMPDSTLLRSTVMSLLCFYKGTQSSMGMIFQDYFIENGDLPQNTHDGYRLYINGGIPVFALANGSFYAVTYSSGVAINDDEWHSILVTRDSSAFRFYVDWNLVLTVAPPDVWGYPNWYGVGGPIIGRGIVDSPAVEVGSYGYYLVGWLDEIQLFNRALSPGEVSRLAAFYKGE